ncbi:DNA glycosylase [Nitzschia inconspicua]|uniref:DNA glycosylase n=1 Tax=Nitzschia inconspicua TaxID=303405 RepID=A0A9K3LH66_9STRA|nr:DNA glycosylase [Nitzschia inconspicua]
MSRGNNNNDILQYFSCSREAKRPRLDPESSIQKEGGKGTPKQQNVVSTTWADSKVSAHSPSRNEKKRTPVDIIEIDIIDNDADSSAGNDESLEAVTSISAANPFAKFAYKPVYDSSAVSSSAISAHKREPNCWKVSSSLISKPKSTCTKKQPPSNSKSSTGTTQQQQKNGFVRMKDLTIEEQNKITKKWHSLADPSASLEVRRYQVLLAARLHARCQEPTVRKAMNALREAMPEGVSVETMAAVDAEVLAHCISNLQFYNVKAQQVVKAAQEIQSRFQGEVPEDEFSLSQITGIGKCFADLLAFVNTRKKHEESALDS